MLLARAAASNDRRSDILEESSHRGTSRTWVISEFLFFVLVAPNSRISEGRRKLYYCLWIARGKIGASKLVFLNRLFFSCANITTSMARQAAGVPDGAPTNKGQYTRF